MKKLAFALVVIAVVVGATFGGLSVANAAPALRAVGTTSPGDVTVSGTGWVPGLPVDLFMDIQDNNHHVGVATPDARGGFTTKFGLLGTLIGNHVVIGVQGLGPPVNAPFTLRASSPVDDRVYQEVADIEAKLDDPNHGLAEIKSEVANIEDNVTSPDYGLQEIRDKVGKIINNDDWGLKEIKTEVRDIEQYAGQLTHTVQMSTTGGCAGIQGPPALQWQDASTRMKHVHLTVARLGPNPFLLNIRVRVGAPWDYAEKDLVNQAGIQPGIYTYEFDACGWALYAGSQNPGGLCCSATSTYEPGLTATEEPWPQEPPEPLE